MSRSVSALALALALALAPTLAQAQENGPAATQTPVVAPTSPRDSALDAQTKTLATELRCPVCQGLSLQDSPSELAQQMRSLIKDQLRAGKSPDEVRDYFVSKYGEWILLQPEAHGFNLMVYLLPILGLLAGGVFVVVAARRWTRTAGAEAEQPTVEPPVGRS